MRSSLEDTLQLVAVARRIADENSFAEAFNALALAADLLGREQAHHGQRRIASGDQASQCAAERSVYEARRAVEELFGCAR